MDILAVLSMVVKVFDLIPESFKVSNSPKNQLTISIKNKPFKLTD